MKTYEICIQSLCSMVIFMATITGCKEKQTAKDPARRIVFEAIQAIGGLEQATGWSTRVQKGLYMTNQPGWGHLTANTSRFVSKPDKAKIDNDFSAYDHPFYFTYYLNGDDAWQVANLSVRQSPQLTERMKEYLEKADGLAYFLVNCDTLFLVGEVSGDSLLPGLSMNRVGCSSGEDTIFFDFDGKNHLLVREIESKEAKHTIYGDYRKTGDILAPYHVTVYRNGEKSEEYVWQVIKFNEEIDPAIFEEDRPGVEE
ncbi:MAG: hypothetical protein ACE5OP_09615 [Candidatus Glassbacteria bacterium]